MQIRKPVAAMLSVVFTLPAQTDMVSIRELALATQIGSTVEVRLAGKERPNKLRGRMGILDDQAFDLAIENSADTTDSTTKLCGAVRAGVTTFTAQLVGSIDVDAGNDAGLFALSWNEKGSQQAFTFVPSTELATSVSGQLVIKPLRLGADEYGADLTSDIAFDIVGDPVLTIPPVVP